jgi:hypothetical protein
MTHRPRAERDSERARAAARAIDGSAMTSSAMDLALAQIGAAFDAAAEVNDFKLRVERLFWLGPHHPAVHARFRVQAAMLPGRELHAAIVVVERRWRDERRVFRIACAFGYGNRLSLEILREARLALRLMRFKGMHVEFGAALAALRNDFLAEAAE